MLPLLRMLQCHTLLSKALLEGVLLALASANPAVEFPPVVDAETALRRRRSVRAQEWSTSPCHALPLYPAYEPFCDTLATKAACEQLNETCIWTPAPPKPPVPGPSPPRTERRPRSSSHEDSVILVLLCCGAVFVCAMMVLVARRKKVRTWLVACRIL
eukprot:SAG31_NODE_1031_length_10234_cov_6.100049_10_plen_158_part_00